MANLTPNHPQYKQDAEELAQINGSLESMTKDLHAKASARIQQRLRTDLDRTANVESRLNEQLRQMAGAAANATPKLQRANDLATDIVRLQTRNSSVDEQLHNLMIEDSAPGAAHLSAAAVPPLYPTVTGLLRQTLILLIAGVVFGLVAAVAVHKMDPRVYIAEDVDRILGFAPMAVLPDFAQVSDGVVDEHMLRLAAGIEYARQQGNLKSCIFTGTGPGTGVTTVATRVREMLEAMGRETVLVDASGTSPSLPHAGADGLGLPDSISKFATQHGSSSTALLQQLAEEEETGEGNLVITDTAPLAVSAETEYLARLVDCAIIVVESGVSTRSQLREVANSLQRLDVAAVGFVLNRVKLQKADPAFRRSVRDVEQHLRTQGRSFKKELEKMQKQKKLQSPDIFVFYVSEWKAANPEGDVDAAKAEAKRQGYEVVE
jgi:Mrp family chromosome partitioning ATPase